VTTQPVAYNDVALSLGFITTDDWVSYEREVHQKYILPERYLLSELSDIILIYAHILNG